MSTIKSSDEHLTLNADGAAKDLKLQTNGTERAIVKADGNVGIGTSSPQAVCHIKQSVDASPALQVQHGDGDFVVFEEGGGTDLWKITRPSGTNNLEINNINAAATILKTSNTERMRIGSNGSIVHGGTTQIENCFYNQHFAPATFAGIGMKPTTNIGYDAMRFNNNGGSRIGTIACTTTSTAYNTSSDYRLKENVVDMTGSIDRLKALKPSRFNFIADADTTVDGFLAHEVSDIVPEAVTGEKDGMRTEEYEVEPAVKDDDGNVVTEAVMGEREVPDYQGIDQAKLVPLLTSALQEAVAKIEALETSVSDLTARVEALENA